jgi:hypothetical protein
MWNGIRNNMQMYNTQGFDDQVKNKTMYGVISTEKWM